MSSMTPMGGFPAGYPQVQPPRRRRGCLYAFLGAAGLAVLIVIAVVIGVAASDSGGTTKVTAPASPAAGATGHHRSKPARSPASDSSLTGPVGTVYQVSVDHGGKYTVRLDRVLAPASPDNSFDAADPGSYLAGLKFTIRGVSGFASDDANDDVTVQGSDGQLYTPTFSDLAAGTNFSDGQFQVSAGTREIGWVAVELPDQVRVALVQWNPNLFGGTPATWTVRPGHG